MTPNTAMERIAALEKGLSDSRRRLDALCFEIKRVAVATELLAQAVKNIGNAINSMSDSIPGEEPLYRRNH